MSLEFEDVRRQYSCAEIVSRYVVIQKRGSGNQLWGICPFHDDKRPTNFNVYRAKDDIERFRCFACHEGGDVIDFVSLIERCTKPEAVKIIVGNAMPNVGEYKPKKLPPNQTSAWKPIIPVPDDAPTYKPELTFVPDSGRAKNYKPILERMDPYRDAEGKLMFWVVKLRFPDGGKACPQVCYCAGPKGERKWCAKRMEPPYPLMGLDDLAAYPTRHVMIVEGEKCKTSHDENCPENASGGPAFISVSWLGGSDCVEKVDWSPLVGRKNNYYSDNDTPGRQAMDRIFEIVEIEKSGTG